MNFHLFPGRIWPLAIAALSASWMGHAEVALPLYSDSLRNGFQDWSWGTRDFNNSNPVHSGTRSIRVSAAAWEALSLAHSEFGSEPYAELSFWANGGSVGGQKVQIYAEYGTNQGSTYALAPLPTNVWQQFSIPLAGLGVADVPNLRRITWQLTSFGNTGTFYVDDIELTGKPAPPTVQLNVNADATLRVVDSRWLGINTAIWDSHFDSSPTLALLNEAGLKLLRFPGGSISDEYHWGSNKSFNNPWQWATSFSKFAHVATNIGAQVFITVNYGTGTPAEAAGWVRHSNVTNQYAFQYWEIGNENYGTWETDSNTYPHDPFTYATRARDYFQQMKAADPTIQVGVVAAPGENSYSNVYCLNHPTVNPRTGTTNYGWTPILLATLKTLGVTPDFLVHHFYYEWTGQESDPLLLQASANWARDAADLRQQLEDYLGPSSTNIELVCTENNSNSGTQGKQSVSLVNALYFADSLARISQTEFNSYIWWDLRNGTNFDGNMDPSLYGWRMYGDIGMINNTTERYPHFYAAKLMQFFAQPGGRMLEAASDYPLLSAYSARATNGALTVLVINKDPFATLAGAVNIAGFAPFPTATLRSYGITQDDAARTNAPLAAQDLQTSTFSGVSSNFTYAFPPYSLTLFTFAPAAPRLRALASEEQPDHGFAFQLEGQSGTPYWIQSSTNLASWTTVSTNTLDGTSLVITNTIEPGVNAKFWRAVWQP